MYQDDIIEKSQKYLMNTYARYPAAIASGSGATLTGIDGKQYIDFSSGIGVNSLGCGDQEWVDVVSKQAGKLAHISNLFYNIPMVELAEKLIKLSGMSKVFFCNSGAEANEGAIKLARKYSFDKYGRGRSDIITLKNSFHGRTITTLAATGQDVFHNYFFPFTEGFVYAEANNIESVENAASDSVCAIMMESIQGEGGVYPLEQGFVDKVFELARERDWLVIFDEVQAGFGRTGKMFGYEHFNVKPDIVTIAKGLGGGLPIGAVLCNEKLSQVLAPGTHGSTFGGNPICCAAALVVLERLSSGGFLESVAEKGQYIKDTIASWRLPIIKDIRGKGLFIGIDVAPLDPKKIAAAAVSKGLLILTAGKSVLRLLPPLVIAKDEMDKGLEILHQTLTEADLNV